MSVIAGAGSRVLVQGITGNYAQAQTAAMLEAGTRVAAGVTPGRGGTRLHGLPVYDSVREALGEHEADCSLVYAPAPYALDAVWEALEGGLRTVVVAAEGVPQKDAVVMRRLALDRGAWLIGPNTIGLISPGEILLGSFPVEFSLPGSVGVVARSGSLAIEVMHSLTREGIGQSTVVAVGGDSVTGRDLIDYVAALDGDPATEVIVYLGEVGGLKEHALADGLAGVEKPVVAYVAGACAPPNKRMGHIGAIVQGHKDSAQSKNAALAEAGAQFVFTPWEIGASVRSLRKPASEGVGRAEAPTPAEERFATQGGQGWSSKR